MKVTSEIGHTCRKYSEAISDNKLTHFGVQLKGIQLKGIQLKGVQLKNS